MLNIQNVKYLTMIANEDLRDLEGSLLKLVVVNGETRVTRTTVLGEDAQFILHRVDSKKSSIGKPVGVVQLRVGGYHPVKVADDVTVTAGQYAYAAATATGAGTIVSSASQTTDYFPLGYIIETKTGGYANVLLVAIHKSNEIIVQPDVFGLQNGDAFLLQDEQEFLLQTE